MIKALWFLVVIRYSEIHEQNEWIKAYKKCETYQMFNFTLIRTAYIFRTGWQLQHFLAGHLSCSLKLLEPKSTRIVLVLVVRRTFSTGLFLKNKRTKALARLGFLSIIDYWS